MATGDRERQALPPSAAMTMMPRQMSATPPATPRTPAGHVRLGHHQRGAEQQQHDAKRGHSSALD